MPSIGDLIQITSCSTIMSQQACNVFYFAVAAWTGNMTIAEVLEYWDENHLKAVIEDMVPALLPDTITWRNLDNTAEIVSVPMTSVGANTGDSAGPFVAFSARLYGGTAETRSGWKRFAGVNEAGVTNGELTSGTLALFQSALDVLFADVTAPTGPGSSADAWLINTIVGRTPTGELDLSRAQPIVDVVAQPRITTQNTRKVGRGS